MQDSGFAPTPYITTASADAPGSVDNAVASRSSKVVSDDRRNGAGLARGELPSGALTDAVVVPEPQAKNGSPTRRSAGPAPEPVAQTFPESWRDDLAGGDKAFRKT